jgi:hypothetical protein
VKTRGGRRFEPEKFSHHTADTAAKDLANGGLGGGLTTLSCVCVYIYILVFLINFYFFLDF